MTEELLDIEINGRPIKARKGAMIIEATDEAGILVPRFCYHKKLSVAANCRMCLVEVEKAPKPLPACATPVMDGMKISTRSPLALKAQKSVMEFLLINHPLDCPICDQGGECELQDIAMGYGRDVSRFNERKRVVKDKDLGSLVATDMTRCIHCTRCVRFGEEVAGLPELGSTGRGENMEIGTYVTRAMESELSGNVIDVCPVGAITSKPFRFRARAWEVTQKDSVAPHDGVGSNLHVHIKGSKVVRVVPRENEAVNEVWLSDRDRFSYEGLYSEDRLRSPAVKRDGVWVDCDWETALAHAAEGLSRVRENSGPQALGALVSPSATVEEAFLAQQLVRGLGSNNVDHRLRQCDFSDQSVLPVMPWLGQPLAELERSAYTLLVGSDARREQPLVNHRIRKAVRAGGKVGVINPIAFDFNYDVEHVLVSEPAGMVHNLACVAKALGVTGHAVVDAAGPRGEHESIAAALKTAERVSVVVGSIAASHPHASSLRALAGLIAEQAGGRFGVLTEGANAAGASIAGALPHRGAGGAAVTPPGSDALAMTTTDVPKGQLLLGIEPERDCYDSHAASAALEAADFVVSLSCYDSPAMRAYADVLVPIAPYAENEGTFVNVEARWQSFDAVVPPLGDSRPAWKVLRVLGNVFEIEGFDYIDRSAVLDAVDAVAERGPPDNLGCWRVPDSVAESNGALQRLGVTPMYAVDPLVRRAAALQHTMHAAEATIGIHPSVAEKLGLADGDTATAQQNGSGIRFAVSVDDRVAPGCVHLPTAVANSTGLGPAFGVIEVRKD